MKLADMRKKSTADLEKQAAKLRQKIAQLKQEAVTKQEPNNQAIKGVKRELAQVLTVMNDPNTSTETAKATKDTSADDKKEEK